VFRLVRGPIDSEALRRAVAGPKNGAVVVFHGDARGETSGRKVQGLAYEAYEEMALAALRTLAAEMVARHGVSAVACTHRLGPVPVGESAVVVAVAAPHREAALAAVADFLVRLKQDVPIWKQERFEDGAVWVGSPASEAAPPRSRSHA
jgi:molybdopterin synthase catalytic subunit